MNLFDVLFAKKLAGGGDYPAIIKRVTGNPVEFTDGASAPLVKCVTQITGSQDLHGYDKPWVGGAGKNILNLSFSDDVNTISGMTFSHTDSQFTLNGTATTPSYYSLTFSTPPNVALNANYTFSVTVEGTIPSGLFSLVFYNGSTAVVQARVNTTDSKKKTFQVTSSYDKCVLLMESIQNGGAYNCTIKTQLESGSTATTFAPYSNICPITAYTEGEIEVRGKNIIRTNPSDYESGTYSVAGEEVPQANRVRINWDKYGKVIPGNTYTLSGKSPYQFFFFAYDENDDVVYDDSYSSDWVSNSLTFSTQTATRIRLAIRISTNVDIDPSIISSANPQLEKGSTATTYEPYTSTTHTTTYPSAIYRGSEDCVNGEVTTEWGMISNYAGETLPGEWISDRDEYAPGTTPTTGAQVAYELATPTTSSVTPTNLPIKSLSGYNHIESTTGDLDITYLTEGYQEFVDEIESTYGRRKGGKKPIDVFRMLEGDSEPKEEEKEEQESEEMKK